MGVTSAKNETRGVSNKKMEHGDKKSRFWYRVKKIHYFVQQGGTEMSSIITLFNGFSP